MIIKKSKGFTIIELMVVVVIIGILVAISIPNFITVRERATTAGVKTNMHTYQTLVEMYSVEWTGMYPQTPQEMKNGAIEKNYWKIIKNPFTNLPDDGTTTITSVSTNGDITPATFKKGNIAYIHGFNGYTIYGSERDGGSIISGQRVFALTNN